MRVNDVPGNGTGGCCSSRHRVLFDSRDKGSECVGQRGGQWAGQILLATIWSYM